MSQDQHNPKPATCRTILLTDDPAANDNFGGAHQRLADALTELVWNEPGGRTIGLEGDWGSGKSTVVKLLQRKAEETRSTDCSVVIFDAWAHQGDPLRRTFLEHLMIHFQALKWLNPKLWTTRREELARRRRVIERTTTPRLGRFGKILALTLALTPAGLALLEAGLLQGVSFALFSSLPPNILFIVGLVLCLLPFVLLIANFRNPEGWSLLVQKEELDATTEVVETPEPTSVEFATSFHQLFDEALEPISRRVLIVLDNLDRVPVGDASSMLSTLQTFLEYGQYAQVNWLSRVWVLIPYDRDGLARLWSTAVNKAAAGDMTSEPSEAVSDAFFAKRFQILFHVSPLIRSDWHGYFLRLLREAFPDHDETDFHAVYRIFDTLRDISDESPTPRNIKAFVNQIGAIHRQWGDTFPLSHIAYFVITPNGRSAAFAEGLRNGQHPDQRVAGLLGENARDNLAAMMFNVEVQLARQLLLRDPVLAALSEGNAEALSELAKNNATGFWEVLEKTPFLMWADGQEKSIACAATALSKSGLLSTASPYFSRQVRHDICQATLRVKRWPIEDAQVATGVADLLSISDGNRGVAPRILIAISEAVPSGGRLEGSTLSMWTAGLLTVLQGYKEHGLNSLFESSGVPVHAKAEGFLDACIHMARQDPDGVYWSTLRPRVELPELDTVVNGWVINGSFGQDQLRAIRVVRAAIPNWDWQNFIANVSARLNATNNLPPTETVSLLEALWILRSSDPRADATMRKLAQQEGHIAHQLWFAQQSNHEEGVAWCSLVLLYCDPAIASAVDSGNSSVGRSYLSQRLTQSDTQQADFVRSTADILRRVNQLDLVAQVLEANRSAHNWVVGIIRYLRPLGEVSRILQPSVICQHWIILRQLLGEDYLSILEELLVQTDLVQVICTRDFEAQDAGLYLDLAGAGALHNSNFAKWSIGGLRKLEEANWVAACEAESDLLNFVVALRKAEFDIGLGQPFADALHAHAKRLATGSITLSKLQGEWDHVVGALSDQTRRVFRRSLYYVAEDTDGQLSSQFLDLYGGELADKEILQEENRFVIQLLVPILKTRNARGLRWTAELVEKHPDILSTQPMDIVADFRQRIGSMLQGEEAEEVKTLVSRLATALNIKIDSGYQRTEDEAESTV